jgi:hypothetical protein
VIHRVSTFNRTICGIKLLDGLLEDDIVIADEEVEESNFSQKRLAGIDQTPCKKCWEGTYENIRTFDVSQT